MFLQRPVRGLAVVVLSCLALAGCAGGEDLSGRAGDVAFAQGMIPHHEQAIEMAEIALTKDTSPAVAKLARAIRGGQDPEVVLMRQWLRDWGAEEAPHGSGPGVVDADDGHEHAMQGMVAGEDMMRLAESSGDQFERLFLELMIAHHEGAIGMAEDVASTTEDLEVGALADAVVTAQVAEIDRMRKLLER